MSEFIRKITTNRKFNYDYESIKEIEAGISLLGCEVKSILQNKIDIQNSYCYFMNGELFLKDCVIQEYKNRYRDGIYNPSRERKILLKKNEIKKFQSYVLENNGITVVPVEVYKKGSLIKLKLSLCKGKTQFDKREKLKLQNFKKEISIF